MNHFKEHKWKYFLCTYAICLFFILLNIKDLGSFLRNALSIISPFIMAIGIAFILNIPMKFIESKLLSSINSSFKRTLSIILTLFSLLLIISALLFFIIPQFIDSIKTLTENIPRYLESFEIYLQKLISDTATFTEIWNGLLATWQEVLAFSSKFFGFAFGHIVDFTLNITSSIVNFVLSIIFAIYMLANKETLLRHRDKVLKAYFPKKVLDKLYYIGEISNVTFSKFISGQCVEAVIIGVLCFIGMMILRIPYALLISVIVGCTSIIPIFGALIGTIPSVFIILIIDPIKAIIFVIFIIVLQQIEGDFIYPKVVGNSVGLSPIWVMFAMLVGGSAFGFLGLLLCIPVFGVIYKFFADVTNTKLSQKNK